MGFKRTFFANDVSHHKIRVFALPTFLENIAQQLYNTADSIIVKNMWATMRYAPLEVQA